MERKLALNRGTPGSPSGPELRVVRGRRRVLALRRFDRLFSYPHMVKVARARRYNENEVADNVTRPRIYRVDVEDTRRTVLHVIAALHGQKLMINPLQRICSIHISSENKKNNIRPSSL